MPPAAPTAAATALLLLLLLAGREGAEAFLLTGLSSRVSAAKTTRATPLPPPLFSVDLQQRGPPRLDEFGLPLEDDGAKAPGKPFKVRKDGDDGGVCLNCGGRGLMKKDWWLPA
jgi:hypothetical protein